MSAMTKREVQCSLIASVYTLCCARHAKAFHREIQSTCHGDRIGVTDVCKLGVPIAVDDSGHAATRYTAASTFVILQQ